MKKSYASPSVLVLASQGVIGPNIASGPRDNVKQPDQPDGWIWDDETGTWIDPNS